MNYHLAAGNAAPSDKARSREIIRLTVRNYWYTSQGLMQGKMLGGAGWGETKVNSCKHLEHHNLPCLSCLRWGKSMRWLRMLITRQAYSCWFSGAQIRWACQSWFFSHWSGGLRKEWQSGLKDFLWEKKLSEWDFDEGTREVWVCLQAGGAFSLGQTWEHA